MSVLGEEAGAGLRNARLAASDFVRKNRGKNSLIGDIATGLSDLGVSGKKRSGAFVNQSLRFRLCATEKPARKAVNL